MKMLQFLKIQNCIKTKTYMIELLSNTTCKYLSSFIIMSKKPNIVTFTLFSYSKTYKLSHSEERFISQRDKVNFLFR